MKNLIYKSFSVMKKTRESSNSQITTAEKQNLVACLASMGATHIEITLFTPDNADLISHGFRPSPRTIEAETQDWYSVIHAQKNVYGSSVNDGYLRVFDRAVFPQTGDNNGSIVGYTIETSTPLGTHTSAPTDGVSTWCGRYYNYLYNHVLTSNIKTGDILCPFPEITATAFGGSYWTNQTGAVTIVKECHQIANTFAASVGQTIIYLSNPNFSEVTSGWYGAGAYTDSGFVCADYYGAYRGARLTKPTDYVYDWAQTFAGQSLSGYGIGTTNIPIFWGEFGDLSGSIRLNPNQLRVGDNFKVGSTEIEDWMNWWINFLKQIRDNLVNTTPQKLVGFNYWGGWENQNTSLVYKVGSGASSQYFPNWRGQMLQAFLTSDGIVRIPVIQSGSFTEASPSFGGRQMHY